MKNTITAIISNLVTPVLLGLWYYTQWNQILFLIGLWIFFCIMMSSIAIFGVYLIAKIVDKNEFQITRDALKEGLDNPVVYFVYPMMIASIFSMLYFEHYVLTTMGIVSLVLGMILRGVSRLVVKA